MLQAFKSVVLVSILVLISGCAGRDFVRPNPEAFRLGQTTYAELVGQMGQPQRTGEALKNDKPVKTITYAYAATGGEPLEAGVIPARAASYYFHNDVLVGHEFLSSFKSDNSNFDEGKTSAIVKGKTTRSEVIHLLGRPTAGFVPPMVKETAGEAIGYKYQTTRGGAFSGFKFYAKALTITFDNSDHVLDVDYTASGNK